METGLFALDLFHEIVFELISEFLLSAGEGGEARVAAFLGTQFFSIVLHCKY